MRLIAGLLNLHLKEPSLLLPLPSHLLGCFERSLDGVPADGVQDFFGDCLVDAKTTERDAPVLAMVHVGAFTVVAKHRRPDARV